MAKADNPAVPAFGRRRHAPACHCRTAHDRCNPHQPRLQSQKPSNPKI